MPKLSSAAAHVVAGLEFGADPDRVTEKAIVDFFRARNVEIIEFNGAVFLAGQFWTTNRAGRLITSMHVDLTDLAEQIVTQLQLSRQQEFSRTRTRGASEHKYSPRSNRESMKWHQPSQ
jgi:hypothetical protein